MNYELALSLRKHLDKLQELNDTVLIRNGVEVSDRHLPFSSVMSYQDTGDRVATGWGSYREVYYYQIGIYANDVAERDKLTSIIRDHLLQPIDLYDEANTKTDKTFHCEVREFTPMTVSDITQSKSKKHYGYFDMYVEIYRTVGEKSFTQ